MDVWAGTEDCDERILKNILLKIGSVFVLTSVDTPVPWSVRRSESNFY